MECPIQSANQGGLPTPRRTKANNLTMIRKSFIIEFRVKTGLDNRIVEELLSEFINLLFHDFVKGAINFRELST